MSKVKSVYDNLLPDVKTELQASARKYSISKKIKVHINVKNNVV